MGEVLFCGLGIERKVDGNSGSEKRRAEEDRSGKPAYFIVLSVFGSTNLQSRTMTTAQRIAFGSMYPPL